MRSASPEVSAEGSAIGEILPPGAAAHELIGEGLDTPLFAEEADALGQVAERRRRDFSRGRECAHNALAALGFPPAPILTGAHREPLWPDGIIGSITHCPGYAAAAVARRTSLPTIGIDAEINDRLPEGTLRLIAREEERRWLDDMTEQGANWDRLLFSAKESVFKAWFPIVGKWLDFREASVTIDPIRRTFKARILVEGQSRDGMRVRLFSGRYAIAQGFLLTVARLPIADESRPPAEFD